MYLDEFLAPDVHQFNCLTTEHVISNDVGGFSRSSAYPPLSTAFNVHYSHDYMTTLNCFTAALGEKIERYIQVLKQHLLPSRQQLFQGRP